MVTYVEAHCVVFLSFGPHLLLGIISCFNIKAFYSKKHNMFFFFDIIDTCVVEFRYLNTDFSNPLVSNNIVWTYFSFFYLFKLILSQITGISK